MATKDFIVKNGLEVAGNITTSGSLTLGGKTVSRLIDSDEVTTIINNSSSGFDSDQVVAIIQENPGSQAIATTVYTYTSPANDSEFTGIDDNGQTLSYTSGKVYVYLNGILLVDTVDYIATNGTSVILTVAPDSENVLQIVKHVGTVQSGFDSDQVVAIINENVVSGSVDSDVAAIAQLRRDADSDSIRIQEIATSLEQINELVDSDLKAIADLRNDVDSDSIKIQDLQTQLNNLVDDTGFDSDQIVAIINENSSGSGMTDSDLKAIADLRNDVDSDSLATANAIGTVIYTFVSPSIQTTFTGADDNGQTLSYYPGKVHVYLNGLLLTDTTDYTATNGTQIILGEAADSEDVLTIIKHTGTVLDGLDYIRYDYIATNQQSTFTGADSNGRTLSFKGDQLDVYINGVLLKPTQDYTTTAPTTVVLTSPFADSDDEVTVIARTGSVIGNTWSEVTGDRAVLAGEKLFVDTSANRLITLPSVAFMGDEIRIIDATNNAEVNNITVTSSLKILGSDSDLILDINRTAIGLVYYNTAQGWLLIES